jgi:iron complex outermembrane recepter protein
VHVATMESVRRILVLTALILRLVSAQTTGTIRGTITADSTGEPLHNAHLILSPTSRHADTDDRGGYEFRDVAPGTYEVIVRTPGLSTESKTARVTAGATQTVDFKVRLAAVHESITVTASGHEESTVNAIQSVATLEQTELPLRSAASLGDVLENESGVAKRSFGPGNTRPIIRGFDGDRVLIMEDGMRTGTLSYQSGDHGEPMDVNKLERLEVVRGPATLLYGSSAIGGVVNAISRHEGFEQQPHKGARGYVTGVTGSNNALRGGSAGFEFGAKSWEFWASGGGQRTGNYHMPLGELLNSRTRFEQTDGGLGHFGEKGFANFNYSFTDSSYGIPVDPAEIDPELSTLLLRKHTYKIASGLKNIGGLDGIHLRMSYTDYNHREVVANETATAFFNKQFVYRTVFDQKKRGRLSGSFGFSGMRRDYKTTGEEAIAPPTRQNNVAVYGLESFDLNSLRLQFGGRVEHNGYDPTGLRGRSFTGLSGAFGLSQRLGQDTALAFNYSHSYRAPSLEELYNNGPHPGNLTFELGNPNLRSEQNNGIDVGLRHQTAKVHGELNFFYYRINRFVYLAPTGNVQDGLVEADYLQADSRFSGGEAKLDLGLHPNFWINLAADTVNARLTESKTPLPRIPPVRGRIGFDVRYKGLSFHPEVVLSNHQYKIFPIEAPTAGYAVFNVRGSYMIARKHALHSIGAELFNAGDRLYRNHLSFIKEFAPEIGRGVRVYYSVQLF